MNQQNSPALSSPYLAKGGAYILELNVRDKLSLQIGRLGRFDFDPGRYLYIGSAYGPGGIAARVTRHQKPKGRRLHWHIDYLSAVSGVERVWGLIGGDECEVVSILLTDLNTTTPFAGFGSSDCSLCSAHLLVSTPHLALDKLLCNAVEMFNITSNANT